MHTELSLLWHICITLVPVSCSISKVATCIQLERSKEGQRVGGNAITVIKLINLLAFPCLRIFFARLPSSSSFLLLINLEVYSELFFCQIIFLLRIALLVSATQSRTTKILAHIPAIPPMNDLIYSFFLISSYPDNFEPWRRFCGYSPQNYPTRLPQRFYLQTVKRRRDFLGACYLHSCQLAATTPQCC